ncbi:hypothetical protein BAE44_0002038, partial [Dichanthelium oligosanthes]
IQRDTSRFCAIYGTIESRHQSGKTEDDKVSTFSLQIKDALLMYDGIAGRNYPYMHCWLILKNEPKWNIWLGTSSTGQGGDPEVTGEGSNQAMPPPVERPMGWDRANKQRSDSNSSSSTTCLEVFSEDVNGQVCI